MVQNIIDAIATTAARLEALAHPDAVILPNFIRSIQKNFYSCGAHAVYTISKYYRKHYMYASVEKQLLTDEDGTSPSNIKRVFRMYGLNTRVNTKMNIRALKEAINARSPVLVSLYDGWHYSVAYGFSDSHFFLMNPSLGPMGNIWNAVLKRRFARMWDRWGIIVND